MRRFAFRILNVFAETPLGGNPLAVFEDGRGLSDAEMQALALQFNLSETTFLLPSEVAPARVRIFTPSFEMDFAGHPTLGTAHVVRALTGAGDALSLEMRAGVIPVTAAGDEWTLEARAPRTRAAGVGRAQAAAFLALAPDAVVAEPLWVDTGAEQLLVRLAGAAEVAAARPDPATLGRWPLNHAGRAMLYAWAEAGDGEVAARFFFTKHGALVEDPGTGSACANLGGWYAASGDPLPLERRIRQGEAVGRPCVLGLRVETGPRIRVSGRVIQIARGELTLP